MTKFDRLLATGLGLALVVIAAFALFRMDSLLLEVRELSTQVHQLAEQSSQRGIMQGVLTTSWWSDVDSGSHSITTTRETGESAAAFKARHNDAVAARQVTYPPA